MAKLYVMVGLPGAGKSTIAKEIPDTVHISSDEIRECLYGNEVSQGDPKRVFSFMDEATEECLKDGRDVVYDATSITEELRADIVNKFRPYADEIICVHIDTPVEECLRRNARRSRSVPEGIIWKMWSRFEDPTTWEGFNKLIVV